MTDENYKVSREHECTGDDECTVAPFLLMDVVDNPESVDYDIKVHRFTLPQVAEIMVRVFDQVAAQQVPEGMPAVMAHSRARELLVQTAEQVPPHPDVSASLQDLLAAFMNEDEGADDDV